MSTTFDKNAEITSYVRDKEKGGRERVVCDCRINGALFRMTATITRGASNVRGTVTALDSAGAKMCRTGAKRAERTRAYQDRHPGATEVPKDVYIINCGFTIRTDKDEALKKKTLEKAKALYSQYIREISEEAQKRGIDELNVTEAIYHYSQTFFKVKSLAERTTEKKAGMLKCIAREFAGIETPLHELSENQVKTVATKGKLSVSHLKLASEFFETIRKDKGVELRQNPFAKYLERQPKKKKSEPKNLIIGAMTPKSMSAEDRDALNTYICDNAATGLVLGVLLVAECGFKADEACALTWGDIVRPDDGLRNCSIRLVDDDCAGATHNFTRPVSAFATAVLEGRYKDLRKTYGKSDLTECCIVGKGGRPSKTPIEPKVLRDFCVKALKKCDIRTEYWAEGRKKHPELGVAFLNNAYRARLEEDCGLSADPAAVKFLNGMSLNGDVTADSYRSFTSPEARRYLIGALDRCEWQPEAERSRIAGAVCDRTADGGYRYSAKSTSADKLCELELAFELDADDADKLIRLASEKGISVRVEVMK